MLTQTIAALLLGQAPGAVLTSVQVGGVTRESLVHLGSGKKRPVVFVFHGHGGTPGHAAYAYALQELWPEAVVIYPRGIDIASPNSKQTARGWQMAPGTAGDRDLKFFDAMLAKVKKELPVDSNRVFVCGMSNGGLFTFELFHSRPKAIRAFAAVASGADRWLAQAKTPRPVFMVYGQGDPVVSSRTFSATRDQLLRLNGCTAAKPWGKGFFRYPGKNGADVITGVHSGGHDWPQGTSEAIVSFFKGFK